MKTEKVTDGKGNCISFEHYTWDAQGNETSVHDTVSQSKIVTEYYYEDGNGHLAGEVKSEKEYIMNPNDPAQPLPETITTYSYSYDGEGKKTETITEKVQEGGQEKTITTVNVHDAMGREIATTDSRGKREDSVYDSLGRLIETRETYTADSAAAIQDKTERKYDKNGALLWEKDVTGTVQEYVYDNMNRVISSKVTKGSETKTWTTTYSRGNVVVHTGRGTGGTMTIQDAQITTEKNPEGQILSQTWQDKIGRTVREKSGGMIVDTTWDGANNPITSFVNGQTADAAAGVLTLYLYDEEGQQTHVIKNPSFANTEFKVTAHSITEESVYDKSGNMVKAIDGEGSATEYTYTADGEIATVTTADGAVTTCEYDKKNEDGTTSDTTTYANGTKSLVTKNKRDLITSISDVGDGTLPPIRTDFEYDLKNNMTKEIDGEGNYRLYIYDGMDRLILTRYFDKTGTETLRTKRSYDRRDNLTERRDYTVTGSGETLYRYIKNEYDFLDRLTGYGEMNTDLVPAAADLAPHMSHYTYDIDGNLIQILYPQETGKKVKGLKYLYNTNKWLTAVKAVTDTGDRTLREYIYDNSGKVKDIKDYRDFLGNSSAYTIRSHSYDEFLRPVRIEYKDSSDPATIRESYAYSFDKNDSITKEIIRNGYLSASEQTDQIRDYTWSNTGQLTQSVITDHRKGKTLTTAYQYDAVGNRIRMRKGGRETNYTYNTLNQLISAKEKKMAGEEGAEEEDPPSGEYYSNRTYQFDANGNQTLETDSVTGITKKYTFDADNRLAAYEEKQGANIRLTQENRYDGAGQRIRKTEGGAVTDYFYGAEGLLYTRNGAGAISSLNLTGTEGNIIATARGTGTQEQYSFYHKDIRESTTALISPQGEGILSYEYDDFGATTLKGDQSYSNEICYTGGVYDPSTTLYYLNARYYNPADGRFLSPDTCRGEAEAPATLHLYAYCKNNPMSYTDPSGHLFWAVVNAGFAMYDGYQAYKKGKKKGESGLKLALRVAGSAGSSLVGGKYVKAAKAVYRGVKSALTAAKVAKKASPAVKKAVRVATKSIQSKSSKKIIKASAKKTVKVKRAASRKKKASPPPEEPKYHGNDKRSQKPQHGYIIRDKETKIILKVGISGGKLNRNGSSRRANSQLKKFNEDHEGTHEAVVLRKDFKNRQEALDWETKVSNNIKKKFCVDPNSKWMKAHKKP